MTEPRRLTSDEAALHNASLTPSTQAILLDLDWSPEPAEDRADKVSRYSYSRTLYTNYFNLITLMGLAVYIALPSHPVGQYNATIVGVVFAGGRDMHPSFYNEEVDGTTLSPVSKLRYPFAKEEYNWARGKVPILGICWGSQFLTVAHGGSLVQNLPEDKQHLHKLVPLTIVDKTSWLYTALDTTKIMSNCNHHQGFKLIPSVYRVTALDEEGSPHAFESKEGMLELGFLGHPERLLGDPGMRMMAVRFGEYCKEVAQVTVKVYAHSEGNGDTESFDLDAASRLQDVVEIAVELETSDLFD